MNLNLSKQMIAAAAAISMMFSAIPAAQAQSSLLSTPSILREVESQGSSQGSSNFHLSLQGRRFVNKVDRSLRDQRGTRIAAKDEAAERYLQETFLPQGPDTILSVDDQGRPILAMSMSLGDVWFGGDAIVGIRVHKDYLGEVTRNFQIPSTAMQFGEPEYGIAAVEEGEYFYMVISEGLAFW